MIDQLIFLVRRGKFDYLGIMAMTTSWRLKLLERVAEIVEKEDGITKSATSKARRGGR